MYWEILIAFVLGAIVGNVPWLLTRANTAKAMELLASRSYSDYSVGQSRIERARHPQNTETGDYSSAWSDEHGQAK